MEKENYDVSGRHKVLHERRVPCVELIVAEAVTWQDDNSFFAKQLFLLFRVAKRPKTIIYIQEVLVCINMKRK